jgi:hypothetical protein
VVRGPGTAVHAAGVRRRRNEPADARAFHGHRIDLQLLRATRTYIERHGKPVAFYGDKASVFRNTAASRTGNSVTQFGRAMYELNIDTICANSSPAKRRVERAHQTLQDRMVKEMRLRDISTIAEANASAPSFMVAYNARFAKLPKSNFDAHRPLRADENLQLVLTWRGPRKVTKALFAEGGKTCPHSRYCSNALAATKTFPRTRPMPITEFSRKWQMVIDAFFS